MSDKQVWHVNVEKVPGAKRGKTIVTITLFAHGVRRKQRFEHYAADGPLDLNPWFEMLVNISEGNAFVDPVTGAIQPPLPF